jgi:hypothetical protein
MEADETFVPEIVAQLLDGNEVVIVGGNVTRIRPELLIESNVVIVNT